MEIYINAFFDFGLPLLVLIGTYFIGSTIEKNHYKNIQEREDALRDYPVITISTLPDDWKVGSTELVTGSVVVSLDYFKRFIAGLRAIVGGRIKTYEPLLDRARREAMLRMVEDAKARGYDAVINVRLQTSRLARAKRNGQGTAGVEMLAFGTAITLA